MRITVILDEDVARLLDEAMLRGRVTFEQALNDAVRRGLSPRPAQASIPFEVVPHDARLLAGYDPSGFTRLADDLEDQERAARLR